MQEEKKGNGLMIWSVVILVLAVATYGFFKYIKKDNTANEVSNGLPVPEVVIPEVVTTSYIYKDGTYSAVGEYLSPGGLEEIGVSLTLKDDVVVNAELTVKATRPVSLQFQNTVKDNLKALVVGKKIDEVKLDKVSGSSLTPKGFNAAVDSIKATAKA